MKRSRGMLTGNKTRLPHNTSCEGFRGLRGKWMRVGNARLKQML
jgi:hypothetical protein